MTAQDTLANPLLKGSLLLGGAAILFPVKDAFVKSVGESVSPLEAAAVYFATQATLTVLWLALSSSPAPSLTAATVIKLALRSSLMVLAIVLFFASVQNAPLAEAVVLFTTNALFVVLLGFFVLKEQRTLRSVFSVALGFIGVIFIIRPSASNMPDPNLLLALGSALCYGSFMIATRALGQNAGPVKMLLFDGLVGTTLCVAAIGVYWALLGEQPNLLSNPYEPLARLICSGVIGTASALLVILAMRVAPASKIAVWGYLEIPSAVLVGFVAFNDRLDITSLFGAGVIVFACYLSTRQSRKARSDEQSA